MMGLLSRYKKLSARGVLGLNARNGDYIMRCNKRSLYPLVDDKILCKERLLEAGIHVPKLLATIATQHDAAHLLGRLQNHSEFVIKPANGSGGEGILVITSRRNQRWITSGGKMIDLDTLEHYVSNILTGMYSLAGHPDRAMIETLVHFDPVFGDLTAQGVPDIRVIVYHGYPIMAMTRLPTRQSDGKANLHQGAVGAGIDISSGCTVNAVLQNANVDEHPDTGAKLTGFQIPGWQTLLELSARCHDAIPLGYLGVDIVLDRDLGPLVLELNARPGLNIQIANGFGLRPRLRAIDKLAATWGKNVAKPPAAERVATAKALNEQRWRD